MVAFNLCLSTETSTGLIRVREAEIAPRDGHIVGLGGAAALPDAVIASGWSNVDVPPVRQIFEPDLRTLY